MAIVFSRLTGTFNSTFQFGKGGVKVKTASNTLSVRDAGDANPAAITALSTLLGVSTGNAVIKAPNAADNADAKIIAGEIQTLSTGIHFDSHGYIKDGGTDGVLLVMLEDGTTPGVIRVGSPSNGNDAVNLSYFNGNASPSAAQVRKVAIASGGYAATYTGATNLPDNAIITRCVVDVLLALDVGITIKIGTDEAGQTERFQATTDNDSQVVNTYETTPFVTMKTTGSSATQKLLVTLSSLPTVGTVNVYVEYLIPQAW